MCYDYETNYGMSVNFHTSFTLELKKTAIANESMQREGIRRGELIEAVKHRYRWQRLELNSGG